MLVTLMQCVQPSCIPIESTKYLFYSPQTTKKYNQPVKVYVSKANLIYKFYRLKKKQTLIHLSLDHYSDLTSVTPIAHKSNIGKSRMPTHMNGGTKGAAAWGKPACL